MGDVLQASAGDRILVPGRRVSQPVRDCLVLDVRGPDGHAPYFVRWGDNGHEGIFFPGNDAKVEPFVHKDTKST